MLRNRFVPHFLRPSQGVVRPWNPWSPAPAGLVRHRSPPEMGDVFQEQPNGLENAAWVLNKKPSRKAGACSIC